MKPRTLIWLRRLLLTCLSLVALTGNGQYIYVNLSFKSVLNPTNGLRYYAFTQADLEDTIARANAFLAAYERGYRFRLVDPLQDVGGLNDLTGPSKWYGLNPRDLYEGNTNIGNAAEMENEALAAPFLYSWNSNAVNYYIVAGYGPATTLVEGDLTIYGQKAGDGSYPPGQIVTLGTINSHSVLVHETGHYFDLFHTQGGCNCKTNTYPGCSNTNGIWVGDDDIADTLLDSECLNEDTLALANFNKHFADCSSAESNLVDDTFFNIMSYHPGTNQNRMTELQLDKWTDVANKQRVKATSGRTRFVSTFGSDAATGLASTAPLRTVGRGVTNSSAGDIVLLRPGNYNERFTINRPITLRATRAGWATIGKP